MRILFVLSINLSNNGPSVHLLKDIISASSVSHDVDVICNGASNVIPQNVRIYSNTFVVDKKLSFIKRFFKARKQAKQSFLLVKGNEYDLVFLQSSPISYWYVKAFSRFRCPIVYNAQDLFPHNLFFSKQMPGGYIAFRIFNHIEKKSYKRITRIITISEDMKDTIMKYVCSDGGKVSVVYNWSYSDNPIVSKSKTGIVSKIFDRHKFNVVYAGNLGKMQNVNVLIEAAKLLSEETSIHFTIIGDGVYKEKLRKNAESLSNVSFYDLLPASCAESIYGCADLNVITLVDKCIYTALPSKTATCLRSEKPCLFCINRESKFSKLISREKGISVCDSDDIKKIASTIRELSKTKDSCFSRLRFVKKVMSAERNPFEYVKIFEEIFNSI